jgi:hypothetical protein
MLIRRLIGRMSAVSFIGQTWGNGGYTVSQSEEGIK